RYYKSNCPYSISTQAQDCKSSCSSFSCHAERLSHTNTQEGTSTVSKGCHYLRPSMLPCCTCTSTAQILGVDKLQSSWHLLHSLLHPDEIYLHCRSREDSCAEGRRSCLSFCPDVRNEVSCLALAEAAQ